MSKRIGIKIGIRFTEELINEFNNNVVAYESQLGEWIATGSYSSSNIQNARDKSTSTYWEARSANLIKVKNSVEQELYGIKIYVGSSYRPTGLSMSIYDEEGGTLLHSYTATVAQTTGWQTFLLPETFTTKYYEISFGYSSRLYLYELAFLIRKYEHVQNGFTISGLESVYQGGNLILKTYQIEKIEIHPDFEDNKTILITLDRISRFQNVKGLVNVSYDASIGNLVGVGGAVESFSVDFVPEDLEPYENPLLAEHLILTPSISINLIRIYYRSVSSEEQGKIIVMNASITATITYVGVINP